MPQDNNHPKEKKDKEPINPSTEKGSLKWDHEEDNCGIDPDENPCGDANEY